MITITLEHLEDGEWITTTRDLDVDADMSLSGDATIDSDMCELPRLIAYYGELGAELQAQASRKRQNMEAMEAERAIEIRAYAVKESLKITEPGIKERITAMPIVSQARNDYYDAVRQHTMVDGFYRALREKASLAIALCYKQKEEMRLMNNKID